MRERNGEGERGREGGRERECVCVEGRSYTQTIHRQATHTNGTPTQGTHTHTHTKKAVPAAGRGWALPIGYRGVPARVRP